MFINESVSDHITSCKSARLLVDTGRWTEPPKAIRFVWTGDIRDILSRFCTFLRRFAPDPFSWKDICKLVPFSNKGRRWYRTKVLPVLKLRLISGSVQLPLQLRVYGSLYPPMPPLFSLPSIIKHMKLS